jgi:peptide chain release factor subunit 1
MTQPQTSTIPRPAAPSPDVAIIHAAMRRAAEASSDKTPILSLYADLRPEAHGERPYARAELIVVRDRLNRLVEEQPAHSPARRSVEADRERVMRMLEDEALMDAEGLAVLACDGLGLWEALATAEPFETDVAAGSIADLYQLARLADANEGAVVALVDSQHCRLFTWRRGALRERTAPADEGEEHRRHDQGGWSQASFQRHIDEQDRRFHRRVAEAIDRLAAAQHASTIVIAADERSSGAVLAELPERARSLVSDIRRIAIGAGRDEVESEVAPLLAGLAADRSSQLADRAVAGARAGDLGAVGIEEVRTFLAAGAVAELVLDGDAMANADRWERARLVRAALLTDASVVVADHAGLRGRGGVGAVLRFRPSAGH